MESRRATTIKSKATDLLKMKNKFFPGFDIVELIEELGIKYIPVDNLPEHISGASMIDRNVKIITVNRRDLPVRQRFTAAHELGHILLGHDTSLNINEGAKILFRNQKAVSDWREVEANFFAASLLVPEELLERELKDPFLSVDGMESLVKRFDVSSTVMALRLSALGYL